MSDVTRYRQLRSMGIPVDSASLMAQLDAYVDGCTALAKLLAKPHPFVAGRAVVDCLGVSKLLLDTMQTVGEIQRLAKSEGGR